MVHSAARAGVGGTGARCDDLRMSPSPSRPSRRVALRERSWLLLAMLIAPLLGAFLTAGPAAAAPAFPPQPVDRIGPGVQVVTHGVRCTAGFAFRDRAGRSYLGYAARCASPAGLRAVDGCRHRSWPRGTRVRVVTDAVDDRRGRTLAVGVLRYSSWLAMRESGTRGRQACRNNDFALVRLPVAPSRVVPTLDYWDGPVAAGTLPGAGHDLLGCTAQVVTRVRTLAPGALRIRQVWRWGARTIPAPGLRSDVGAGFVDDRGRAAGILLAGHEGRRTRVTSLERVVDFARRHGVPGLRLVPGGAPFHRTAVF